MTGVGGKCQRSASPSAMLDSGAMFETTSQSAGAVTASSYVAFMSGWSKHAYTRCASNVSRSE